MRSALNLIYKNSYLPQTQRNRFLASALFHSTAIAQDNCSLTQYIDGDGNPVIGQPTGNGVIPELCNWTSGDAGQECGVNLGYDFGVKVDGWDGTTDGVFSGGCDGKGSCELAPNVDNKINITNNDGTFFDWSSSPYNLGAVVVKAGPVGASE